LNHCDIFVQVGDPTFFCEYLDGMFLFGLVVIVFSLNYAGFTYKEFNGGFL